MTEKRCATCGNPNRIPTYSSEDGGLFNGSRRHLASTGHEFVPPKEVEP